MLCLCFLFIYFCVLQHAQATLTCSSLNERLHEMADDDYRRGRAFVF